MKVDRLNLTADDVARLRACVVEEIYRLKEAHLPVKERSEPTAGRLAQIEALVTLRDKLG